MQDHQRYIQFFPSLKCNLNCDFCFIRPVTGYEDMPGLYIEQLLHNLQKAHIKNIDILGGEPTLYPHLDTLVDRAIKEGFQLWISTNGSDLSCIYRLLDMGVNVGVSVNDFATLRRLPEKVVDRIFVKILYTPSADPLVQTAIERGFRRVYILYPDVMDNKSEISMPFFEFLRVFHQKYAGPDTEAVYCEGFISSDTSNKFRCPAGTTKLTVMPDGSVFPCYLLASRKEFLLGNIFKHTPEELWQNEKLSFFKHYRSNSCSNAGCFLHQECKGGCPALSLLHRGSLDEPDPRCCPEGS